MNTTTAQRQTQNTATNVGNGESKGQVAAVAPPRLPYQSGLKERFGIDQTAWRALVDAIFPSAKTVEGVILALSYCRARGLDPFKRPVHVVPIWSSTLRKEVESVWPGINELRSTAFRTKQYAGCDPTNFGDDITETFSGHDDKNNRDVKETVTFPAWAQITVYRIVDGEKRAFHGPRVYYKGSFGQRGKLPVPNEKWARNPSYMLEKVAEAAALRKAFPEELGNDLTVEEMEGRMVDVGSGIVIDNEPPPPRPTRQRQAAQEAGRMAQESREAAEAQRAEPEQTPEPEQAQDEQTQDEQPQATGPADVMTYPQVADQIIAKIKAVRGSVMLDNLLAGEAEDLELLRVDAVDEYARVNAAVTDKRASFGRR